MCCIAVWRRTHIIIIQYTRKLRAYVDYIIAVISEEFGALFVLFIAILFLFIGYKVLNKIFIAQDEFVKLVLVAVVSNGSYKSSL